MKKYFLFFFLIILSWQIALSQNSFLKAYSNLSIFSTQVRVQSDRSVVLFATIENPVTGLEIIHLDSAGNILSAKMIYTGNAVGIVGVMQDSSNNWIILSSRELIKLDSNFNLLWVKLFSEFPYDHFIYMNSLLITDNGSSYYMTGYRDSLLLQNNKSLFLMKTDSSGNVLWAKYYDARDSLTPPYDHTQESGLSIAMDFNGILNIGGFSSNDTSFYNIQSKSIFKIDTLGNFISCYLQQDPSITSSGPFDLGINSIVPLPGNSLIISGSFHPNPSSITTTSYVMETDSMLNSSWIHFIDVHSSNPSQSSYPVRIDRNAAGNIYWAHTNPDSFPQLVKLSSNGQMVWMKQFIPPDQVGFLEDMAIVDNGIYLTVNSSPSVDSIFLIRTDTTNHMECFASSHMIVGTGFSQYGVKAFFHYDNYTINIQAVNGGGIDSLPVINTIVYCDEVSIEERRTQDFFISPNPFSSIVNLHFSAIKEESAVLQVFNSIGKSVFEKELFLHDQWIDLTGFPDGIYLFSLITSEGVITKKMVSIKK